MSTLTTITETTFEQQVAQSNIPVVVEFGAPWCPPCRAIAPLLEQLAQEYAGRLVVGTVNVDEEPNLAIRFGVSGLPTLIVFQAGQELQRIRGAASKATLRAAFDIAVSGAQQTTIATPAQ